MQEIKEDILKIKERNQKVEFDKAWELSWVRRLFIAGLTYVLAGIWLWLIEARTPWLNAFIPAVGYILSTLTLPFLKNWWMKVYEKKYR